MAATQRAVKGQTNAGRTLFEIIKDKLTVKYNEDDAQSVIDGLKTETLPWYLLGTIDDDDPGIWGDTKRLWVNHNRNI